MLVNLLSNAVKFTPEGGRIGLDVRGNLGLGTAYFTVWDTGIGISAEQAQRLFRPFVQIDSGLARQYGGSGLGLSLVYRMAEMHNGSVALESTPGQGSRFTISLPWNGAVEPGIVSRQQPEAAPFVNLALVVEDSVTTAEQIMRYLSEGGTRVSIHPSGAKVVERAVELQPDVILLDILLPEYSGWEVLGQLKAEERTQNIPVVIVSVIDEPARGMALGAAEYVVKPVTRVRLMEALGKAMAPGHSQKESVASARLTSVRQPLILIAEDNYTNQTAFADYLSAKGYRLSLAATGIEAVQRGRETHPDLVLMDIQMPGMDGLEAIRRLRSYPDFQSVPIIALTALAMPGDQQRCMDAGANDYLPKPVSLKLLAETIERYLQRKQP